MSKNLLLHYSSEAFSLKVMDGNGNENHSYFRRKCFHEENKILLEGEDFYFFCGGRKPKMKKKRIIFSIISNGIFWTVFRTPKKLVY